MVKKLSKKESEEVVTKGYLNYVLNEKLEKYVTKDYLKNQNYVTQDMLL